ncbi:Intraflagellar transport protein 43 [Nowakowskiella sp. JEL0407]|nr:Intraflagellar transport protein 43 [Nowakowskiella sp. JEL0407]
MFPDNAHAISAVLTKEINDAIRADIQSEGDSPPPSRPAPQPVSFANKKRRQFKSTENITKLLTQPQNINNTFDDDSDELSPTGLFADQTVEADIGKEKIQPRKESRRKSQKQPKSGWDNEELQSRRSRTSVSKKDKQDEVDIDAGDIDDDLDEDASKPANIKPEQTEGIMIIPDLKDVEDEELVTSIAAPPTVKQNRVKTIRELDRGIDLSVLTSVALLPPEMVMEEDRPWDWDILFTSVSSELWVDKDMNGKGTQIQTEPFAAITNERKTLKGPRMMAKT